MVQQLLYPKTQSPITLAGHTIKNRIIMGSMHTNLEEEWNGFEKLAAFYAERVAGGAGLIVTGGIAPNLTGRLAPFAATMSNFWHVRKHRKVTSAVEREGGKILMQILHAGRYSYHPFLVSASDVKSPITPFAPRSMSVRMIKSTVMDFANAAMKAREAGYHGVEIMGSEGYLLNQFIAPRTNKRQDEYGGSFENRIRFPLEIVQEVKRRVGDDFIVMFRLSLLDLVDEGSTWEEVTALALKMQAAGVTIFNSGIGWHEAKIPTISTVVPRKEFSWVTGKLKKLITIPIVATNRFNNLDDIEESLVSGEADMVSMARPFLADPEIVKKSFEGRKSEVNTCIACNQACLDHTFANKRSSCLVNPQACHETEMVFHPTDKKKKLAVIGSGPSGMAFAVKAAERGHEVTLFEKQDRLGGQFLMAQKIPGKSEFKETLRYFDVMLKKLKVTVKLGKEIAAQQIQQQGFDEVILSTGVIPRQVSFEGHHADNVLSYVDVLKKGASVGQRVGIIGTGGIGIDTALFLLKQEQEEEKGDSESFAQHWGIDKEGHERGSLLKKEKKNNAPSNREIYLLQRSEGRIGRGLGKTTLWVHRLELQKSGVKVLTGVEYLKFEEGKFHLRTKEGPRILDLDHIIVCAGQDPLQELAEDFKHLGMKYHLIGGARDSAKIDAKRAIKEAYELASRI